MDQFNEFFGSLAKIDRSSEVSSGVWGCPPCETSDRQRSCSGDLSNVGLQENYQLVQPD